MGYDLFIIVTLPLLWLALNIFSFITIFLYQLGHALPALLFSRDTVSIYIGTYGDNNSKHVRIGRLVIYIKPKLAYLKQNGICLYNDDMAFNRQIATLLGGLAMSLIMLCVLTLCIFDYTNAYIKIGWGIALLVVAANLIINLFPRKLLVKSSKRLHYSDGFRLILMMEDKVNYHNIMNACRLYDADEYAAALIYLEQIDEKYMEESLFSLMLSCYINLKNFEAVKPLQEKYKDAKWQESVTADEYYWLGFAAVQLKQYDKALANFDKAITLAPNHFNSRKDRAFVYNAIKNYEAAKDDATKAVFINERSSEAYSSRAYANFMLGRTGEAFTDADKALTLNESNAYAQLVMGMYLSEKGNMEKARQNFERAKSMEPDMLYVDEQFALVTPKPVKKAATTRKPKPGSA